MNNPPPYTDINGISRAVMKDNDQVTIVTYNGNARPGEIVVDLEVNPPSIYVGNNEGQLTLVASGGEYGNADVAAYLPTYTGNVGLTNLVFSPTQIQDSAYAGGVGTELMIDTNRTDSYEELGSADKPFKTFAAAIAAAAAANPTGTIPYKFVLMGCNVSENVDFSSNNFNFITIATTSRAVFNGTVTFGNSALKQIVVRDVEFANTFTILGDGTASQMNNCSFYNVTFGGAVNITATNATAFYEAAFSGVVNFTNINYMYINGAQFTGNLTFTVDDSGATPTPAAGIAPCIVIGLNFIANNLFLSKVGAGAGFLVFQPHMARFGLGAGAYTVPANFLFQPQGCTIRGTWTNNGSTTIRNSSFDNAIQGTAPTYAGTIGGNRIITPPVAYSSLVAAAGARAFVNDGNLVASGNFGAQIAGGGANIVPVWSNGTNWYIG